MDNSCQVMADVKKVYDNLIIINLYNSLFTACHLTRKFCKTLSTLPAEIPNESIK